MRARTSRRISAAASSYSNAQTGENREVEISMNHPLRYAGLTFYQYQMDAGQAARAGRARAVVGAAGRPQPELVDALYRLCDGRPRPHHSIHVPPRRLSLEKENEMKKLKPWLPLILTAIAAAWFLGTLSPPPDTGFRLQRIRQAAARLQWTLEADGFARAQFAPGNPREADPQHRAVERLERGPENHLRQRMARQRDDEPRRGRCLARLPRR